MAALTEAQLQHFAFTFVWLAMCGGALGALAFGLIMSVLTRVIAGMRSRPVRARGLKR